MKIIDNHGNLKENFVNLPEGNIFKFNNQCYMKTKTMILYDDIDILLDNGSIYDIEQVEEECQIVNAICLHDFAPHCHFDDGTLVEPLKTELHIV